MKRNKTYGEQIRERREELGYSIHKLSLKSGLSKSSISAWEEGIREPQNRALICLGKALGIEFGVQKVYMAVTPDKYSLPLAVTDSAEELAEICGVTKENIFSRISEGKKLRYPSYIMVEIEEGDDE